MSRSDVELCINDEIGSCHAASTRLALLALMAPPCPHCGSVKTGHAKRRLMSWLLGKFGFRLRVCGGCRRYRILPRHRPNEVGLKPGSSEPLEPANVKMQGAGDAYASGPVQRQAEPVQPVTTSEMPASGSEAGNSQVACPECGSL